jgi:hypothetical protein
MKNDDHLKAAFGIQHRGRRVAVARGRIRKILRIW